MKIVYSFLLFLLFTQSDAAGSITHMFIAKEAVALLPDKELQHLIQNNMDAYLVGANYPDSGYIRGTHYGFDSHWERFINVFITYLHEQYPYPEQQNPKLIAFLLGCATHQTVDEIFHGAFINKISTEDFHGNWKKAHLASERNLDFLITFDKKQWLLHPHIWWLPINDLLAVYRKMGKKNYTASEILWGNIIYSFTAMNEKMLTLLGYPYAKWQTPWLAHNYSDSPQGILFAEQLASHYMLDVWDHILNRPSISPHSPPKETASIPTMPVQKISPSFTFAKTIIRQTANPMINEI